MAVASESCGKAFFVFDQPVAFDPQKYSASTKLSPPRSRSFGLASLSSTTLVLIKGYGPAGTHLGDFVLLAFEPALSCHKLLKHKVSAGDDSRVFRYIELLAGI